jgi:hypothetical protein
MESTLLNFIAPVLKSPVFLPVLTWSVLVFEFMLAAGIAMRKRYRNALMISGIVFHFGIVVMFGLVSFATTMFGALVLYLRPFERPFSFEIFRKVFERVRAGVRGGARRAVAATTALRP